MMNAETFEVSVVSSFQLLIGELKLLSLISPDV